MKNIYVILFITTIFFLCGMLFKNDTLMLYMLLFLYVFEFYYLVRYIQRNITIILFFVAFFTFLMGRIMLPVFVDISQYGDIFHSSLSFSDETYRHIYLSLYITLLSIFIGYKVKQPKIEYNFLNYNPQSSLIIIIRKIAKKLTFFTLPFAFLNILDEIRFVLTHGYQSVFLEYESSLPAYLLVLAVLYKYLVYLYLATLPSKKDARLIIIIFCLVSGLNLVAGDRGEAMLVFFVVIYYFFLRNRLYSNDDVWIGKKAIVALVCSTPIIICFLFLIVFYRTDSEINVDEFSLLLGGFFYQQGASINVIACTYEDYALLPPNRLYSLGAVFDYFTNNYLSRLLFGTRPYSVGSIELAVNGRSLDPAITYLESPNYYMNGGGMGSSFIAEAWYDFGYLGIILFSLFYGYILAKIPKWCGKNIWLCIISMMFFENILYAPRARATTFLVSALSVSFWPIALCIYIYAVSKIKRK